MRKRTVSRASFTGMLALFAAALLAVSGPAFGDEPAKKLWPAEGRVPQQPADPSVDSDDSGTRDEENSTETQPGTTGVAPGGTNGTSLTGSGRPAGSTAMAAPSNDECVSAIPIPAGPLPVLTAPVDITDATLGTDPAYCASTDKTVWYSFTPTTTANYIITICAGRGATGSTVRDPVLALFTSTGGSCPAVTSLACNDTDPGCTTGAGYDQSTVSAILTAGQTYFIVAGWYAGAGNTPIVPGNENIVVKVDVAPGPINDTCAGAIALTLDRAISDSTAGAADNYQSPATAACFAGAGQVPTTSPGRDVVYQFTAPTAGPYSFRWFSQGLFGTGFGYPEPGNDPSQNHTLYVASDCPAGGGTVSCLGGANRMAAAASGVDNKGEEVSCLPLAAGQTVYVYADHASAANAGTTYSIEVYRCNGETEPNDTPATANPLVYLSEGSISPAGDADFWSLGTVAAGDRIFATVDGMTANTNDFDLRVTTDTDTLEYDDADGGAAFGGGFSPVISGTPGTGVPTYLRVSQFSATREAGPYRVQYVIEPPEFLASPPAPEPDYGNFRIAGASALNYFYGGLTPGDTDAFRICAETGDLVHIGIDGDPLRDNTPVNPSLFVWTYALGPNVFGRGEGFTASNLTPSPGTLTGTTPRFTSEAVFWRARYTGVYLTAVGGSAPITFGDYLFSIAFNGTKPVRSSDLTISMTGPASPVATSSIQTYTIAVTNNGMIAQDVMLTDVLPPNLLFVDLSAFGSVTSGFTCSSLPAVGSSGLIECTNHCMAPGDTLTYTLTVQVKGCIGTGTEVTNTATISSLTIDTNLDNNSASATVTTTDDNTCSDFDACTVGDRCEAGECVVDGPLDCNDNSACTDEYCDPATGCVYDPGPGQQCNDGIPCTQDLCDPVLGSGSIPCYFPPVNCDDGNPCTADFCEEATGVCGYTFVAGGVSCDDGNACTEATTCDGAGACGGGTPISCDDGNGCTDDSCSPSSGCQYVNNTAPCDDGNACTTADTCGGGTCIPGPPLNCDDGNCCTIDSCNPASGCEYVPNTTPPTIVTQPSLGDCAVLWPPQHGYADFTIGQTNVAATSACGIASVGFASCNSSQPENGTGVGDGNSTRDCVYTGNTLSLRAERDGACSPTGRVYSMTVVATDVCGNSTVSQPFDVGVWHDRGHAPDPANGPVYSATPGSTQPDTRAGNNGTYGVGCGPGTCNEAGQSPDTSDFDPEMEIAQNASIDVRDLNLTKAAGGKVRLTWTEPTHVPGVIVTRFRIYRMDPDTMFWSLLAEVTKQTTSYDDPALEDGTNQQYKVSAVIK